jgi:hypothetical protein
VSGHFKVKGMPAECSIGLYKLVSLLAELQDAVLACVQGNGEVSAHSIQMICILCMYSKDSLQAILYVCSIG